MKIKIIFQNFLITFLIDNELKNNRQLFRKKDLDDISSIKLKKIGRKEIHVYHNSIDKNHDTKVECIDPDFLKRLQKIIMIKL